MDDEARALGTRAKTKRAALKTWRKVKVDPEMVFVVFGRNYETVKAMFDFLNALGLEPHGLEDVEAILHQESDYIGELLKNAFQNAHAVIVLLTPDDISQLREELMSPADEKDPFESETRPQPRMNVVFEAGMTLGLKDKRTKLVEVSKPGEFLKLPSDISGKLRIRINDEKGLLRLAKWLDSVHCPVSLEGVDLKVFAEKFNRAALHEKKGELEFWEARTIPTNPQGVDYHHLLLKGKRLRSLKFTVRSESPYWRAGFLLQGSGAPSSLPDLIHDRSLLFHVGRDKDRIHEVVAYHNASRPKDKHAPHAAREKLDAPLEQGIGITAEFALGTLICRAGESEFKFDVDPDMMKHAFLVAWGDGNDYVVDFSGIDYQISTSTE